MNDVCPSCGEPVTMAAVKNPRNGKWTAVPLDRAPGVLEGNFDVLSQNHEAFGILGNSLGELPIGVYREEYSSANAYVPHPPSHYLIAPGHTHEQA